MFKLPGINRNNDVRRTKQSKLCPTLENHLHCNEQPCSQSSVTNHDQDKKGKQKARNYFLSFSLVNTYI